MTSAAADMPLSAQTPAQAPGGFSHRQVLRVVTGMMPCILLAGIDQMVVIPALPQIAAMQGGLDGVAWVVTAYLLTSTAATPIWGKMSDLHGRRKMLLSCIALFCLASILCALAQSLGQLVAARAVQGLGGAGLMAVTQSAVADVVSPRERGRYQIYMVSMWALASTAGPIVGGYLTEYLSWRWIFWINLPIGLLALFLVNRALKIIPPRPEGPRRIDWLGSILIFLGTGAVLVALHYMGETPRAGWLRIGLFLVLGYAMFHAAYWHEGRHPEPIIPLRLLENAVYVRGLVIAFLNSFALFAATFLLPIHFLMVAGFGAGKGGLLIMPMLAFNAIAAFTGGQITRRTGTTKHVILSALAIGAVGFLLLAQIHPGTPLWLLILAMVVIGAGTGGAMPTVLILVQNAAEVRDTGSATGTMMLTRAVGGAVGVAIAGAIVSAHPAAAACTSDCAAVGAGMTGALQGAFLLCALVMAVAAAATFGLREQPLRSYSAAEGKTS